jgi:predicted nucleotidyltransferase
MTSLTDIKEKLKNHKTMLRTKYGLNNIAIFGSFSRGHQNSESDLDILVEFEKPIGIEFIDLAEELENILSIKVDLVSKNGIKPDYYQNIKTDLIYV